MTSKKDLTNIPKWVKVYKKEINYRIDLLKEDPETFKEKMGSNPKGLHERCKNGQCVFVPATFLWIHDNKSDTNLDGYRVRAFREALPFKDGDYQVVPQICWNCIENTRDHYIKRKVVRSVEQQLVSDNSRRRRRRKVSK